MSYANREGVVRDVKGPQSKCHYALINYSSATRDHAQVCRNRTSAGGLRGRSPLPDAASRFDRRRNLPLRRGLCLLAGRRCARAARCSTAHARDLRLGSTPSEGAATSRHQRLEGARRVPDRRGDPGPSEHSRAPPALLHAPPVSDLPPADRLPAVALGPPVVWRTGRASPCRLRRAGANHSRPRRADQFRRARRLWRAVVGLHGLEILAHSGSAALAAADAGHRRGRAHQVHAAAAGHRDASGWRFGRAPACWLRSSFRWLSTSESWPLRSFRRNLFRRAEIQQFRGAGVPGWALPVAKLLARLPWPLQFVRGLLFIGGSLQGEGFTGYMLGRKIHGWVPLYFPLAWAIKFPIPLQLLTAAGLAALVIRIRRREATSADLFVWGTAAFFLGTAVLSNFHIGFRHVLPALPLLILGGGFALARWSATSRRSRGDCAFARLARGLLAARLPSWHFLLQRVGRRARARLEIPGRQQSRLGAGSTRPRGLPGAQSNPPREDLHLRLRQPVPLPQARQHGPADAAFARRFHAAALLPRRSRASMRSVRIFWRASSLPTVTRTIWSIFAGGFPTPTRDIRF